MKIKKIALILTIIIGIIFIQGCIKKDIEHMPESELHEICAEESWPPDCDTIVNDSEGKALCKKCKELGYEGEGGEEGDIEQLSESELRKLCEKEEWPPDCNMIPDSEGKEGKELCKKCKVLPGEVKW